MTRANEPARAFPMVNSTSFILELWWLQEWRLNNPDFELDDGRWVDTGIRGTEEHCRNAAQHLAKKPIEFTVEEMK